METEYVNCKHFISVETVGQLKRILADIEDEAPIIQNKAINIDVLVWFTNAGRTRLIIEENKSVAPR